MKKFLEYEFLGELKKLKFILSEYSNNGNMYIGLEDQDGELFTDVSYNFGALGDKEIEICPDMKEFCPGLLNQLLGVGVLEYVDGQQVSLSPLYKVNTEKLCNEYEYTYYA